MAYVPLPIVDVGVDDLHLDLDNYRIPSRPGDETAALTYLFASEDVMEAALLILRDGYFDNEVPIVIEDGRGGHVVLEGNRRVSALKALHNPAIAPSHATELEMLLKKYATEAQNLPHEIRVLVAPDRDTAEPHIVRLHTGLSKRRWTVDQQANYYYSLLGANTTVQDVKRDYPGITVVRFIKMAAVRRFLVAVPFADRTLRDYVAGSSLSMSSFEFAYRRQAIARAIGIKFDRDGLLQPRTSTPEDIAAALTEAERTALEYLVNGFREGRFNTRSPEFKQSADEHHDLVRRLGGDSRPPATTPAIPSSGDGTANPPSGTSEASPQADPPPDRGPNHPSTKRRLDLTGVNYAVAPVPLQHRYHELRGLDVKEQPITTAILLRSVLEMTIKWHFELALTPAEGQLRMAFKKYADKYRTHKARGGTIKWIESGDVLRPGSIEWFNAVAHNYNATVPPADVHQAWGQVNMVLRHLLDSHVAKTS